MKGPNNAASLNKSSSSGAASGDAEHPPGKDVPDMTSPDAKNDLPSEQPAESK